MKIIPFRGYRYNRSIVEKLEDVISPPYDQYKEGLVDCLCDRHPYNIARIIMNKESSSDTEQDNRYTRSKIILDQWVKNQIFIQYEASSVYPYFQNYLVGKEELCRKGFIALGEVTDYAMRIVLPHERTLAKPKEDRLNLLRTTLADTGLGFMLYSDPAGDIEKLLDQAAAFPPLVNTLDLNQEVNQIWRLSDPRLIREIQDLMSKKTVIIADGHHRYEVAHMFKQEVAPKVDQDGRWKFFNYKLMSFVRMESTGITVFPIHRLVYALKGFDAMKLIEGLKEHFVVEDYPIHSDNQYSTLDYLIKLSRNQQRAEANALVLYVPSLRRFMLLKLKADGADRVQWPADKSKTWRKLD